MIILGGGLAGLSAAYHTGGTVYEKEKEVGGTCRSPKVKGYTFDLDIHVLHTKNAYVLDLLIEKLKTPLRIQNRNAWIYSYDTFTKYPFQVNTYGLPDKVRQECVDGFRKASRNNQSKRRYKNYEEWVYYKFGKGIAEYFYLPYSEKFWTISPREMTTDWLDVRVPIPSLKDVIDGSLRLHKKEYGSNALFRYPLKGSISELPNSFISKMKGRVFLNKEAARIDPCGKSVTFKDGSVVFYKSLIATIPVPELFTIMAKEVIPPNVINAVKGLRCNSVLCVNLGIKKSKLNNFHWIYYPDEEYSFFRINFPKNFCSVLTPRSRSSITAAVSYSSYRPLDRRNIVDRVIKDLIKAKILNKRDKIELVDLQDIKYGYPIYDHNRKENIKIIEDYLKKFDIHLAGRYGRWEYQWMDDAILDGKRAAEQVKKR